MERTAREGEWGPYPNVRTVSRAQSVSDVRGSHSATGSPRRFLITPPTHNWQVVTNCLPPYRRPSNGTRLMSRSAGKAAPRRHCPLLSRLERSLRFAQQSRLVPVGIAALFGPADLVAPPRHGPARMAVGVGVVRGTLTTIGAEQPASGHDGRHLRGGRAHQQALRRQEASRQRSKLSRVDFHSSVYRHLGARRAGALNDSQQ